MCWCGTDKMHLINTWGPVCKKVSYSLSNCMYLLPTNLICECSITLKFDPLIPLSQLILGVIWKWEVENIISYDYWNLTVWKGYKTPFCRLGHICGSIGRHKRHDSQTIFIYTVCNDLQNFTKWSPLLRSQYYIASQYFLKLTTNYSLHN